MNRITDTVLVGIALYWLSLVYGCFVAGVVAPADFYKESGVLLAMVGTVHLPSPVRGRDATVEDDDETPEVERPNPVTPGE